MATSQPNDTQHKDTQHNDTQYSTIELKLLRINQVYHWRLIYKIYKHSNYLQSILKHIFLTKALKNAKQTHNTHHNKTQVNNTLHNG
jgi:hypothetical protein